MQLDRYSIEVSYGASQDLQLLFLADNVVNKSFVLVLDRASKGQLRASVNSREHTAMQKPSHSFLPEVRDELSLKLGTG